MALMAWNSTVFNQYNGLSFDKLKITEFIVAFLNIWQLNYRAQYEKTKTNYTLPQDVPQLVKAKANAELYSEVSQVQWKYWYLRCC